MIEIHRANNFTEVLDLVRNARRKGTQTFSYRQLANKLGYRSPRTLAMVHKGQRLPSLALIRKIVEHFELNVREAEFIMLLAQKAIDEKKDVSSETTFKKIEGLRRTLAHVSRSGPCSQESWQTRIYLNENRLGEICKRMKLFVTDVMSDYDSSASGAEPFHFLVKIEKS